jgi:hypothetical protein
VSTNNYDPLKTELINETNNKATTTTPTSHIAQLQRSRTAHIGLTPGGSSPVHTGLTPGGSSTVHTGFDTRWQQYSTHLHTNSTQNNTMTQNGTYITVRILKLTKEHTA